MLNVILFGPPGSGKGTQANRIKENYNLLHLSTGDILRGEIKSESELGKKAKTFMDQGELVPDEVVIGMIANKLDATKGTVSGYIFDGFPRTTAQAVALDEMLSARSMSVALVLALNVDEDELTKRILKRGETSGRADDQNVETIRNRVRVYESQTAPLAEFYAKHQKLHRVEGVGSIDEITDALCKRIENFRFHQQEEEEEE